MKTTLLIGSIITGLMAIGISLRKPETAASKPVAVIELFTSQGCSSCPPADRLLTETVTKSAASHESVYALSFHVDYWNRLGWRDPFSDARFTARQRQYARQFGLSSVYTPQAVLNGSQEFVGSNRARLTSLLAEALRQPASATVGLSVRQQGRSIEADTKLTGNLTGTVLNVALVSNSATIDVNRGENAGRTLTHNNVVRAFMTKRPTESTPVTLTAPPDFDAGNGAVIAYLQQEKTGRILGAERVLLTR